MFPASDLHEKPHPLHKGRNAHTLHWQSCCSGSELDGGACVPCQAVRRTNQQGVGAFQE